MTQPGYDGVIFDMDGTLWDAIDSYCRLWDAAYASLGLSHTMTRPVLMQCMGLPVTEIFKRVNPEPTLPYEEFLPRLRSAEKSLMPVLGGKLYDGVAQGIKAIHASGVKVMMVSNCSPLGIPNFLEFTGLRPYFTDWLAFGDNNCPKDVNIRTLIERYNLKRPVYVGDIQADADSAHRAGAEMIHVTYGFGTCSDAEHTASSMAEVVDILTKKA